MTRRRWIILGSVLAVVLTVGIAGFVVLGDGDDDTNAPVGDPQQGFGQASQEFQDCLAEQGIDPGGGPGGGFGGQPPTGEPPSGGPPGGGAPSGDIQQAFEACQQYAPDLPEGGQFPGAPPGGGGGFTPPSG